MLFLKKNMIFLLLWVVVMTCLFLICFESDYFVQNMPRNAQPELHRTYPFNIHGWIVYLTRSEKLLMDFLYGTLFCSVILAIVMGLFVFRAKSLGASIERKTEIKGTLNELPAIIEHHIRLHSPLSIDECRTRLNSAIDVDRLSLSLTGYGGAKLILGKIHNDNFRLQKRIYYGNSFRRFFYGWLVHCENDTKIEGEFKMHPFAKVFVICWFSFLTFFFIIVSNSIITGRTEILGIGGFLLVISIGMAAIGAFLVKFCCRLGREDERYIVGFLKSVLEATEDDRLRDNAVN